MAGLHVSLILMNSGQRAHTRATFGDLHLPGMAVGASICTVPSIFHVANAPV